MKYLIFILILFYGINSFAQDTGSELIEAAINYHDPNNAWSTTDVVLGLSETRPNAETRKTTISFDNKAGIVCVRREVDGRKITRHMVGDSCSYDINGDKSISASDIEKYQLNDERSLVLRNYYLYLWGLPMKLMDQGTNIDPEIYTKSFNGMETQAVKVTYDAEVGDDIWYFYFHPVSHQMVGYQFYHDEEKGDGEYILLSGIEEISSLKLPRNRAWYTNQDSTLLGTDQLIHSFAKHNH